MLKNTVFTVTELSDQYAKIMNACKLIDDLANKAKRNNEVATETNLRTAEIWLYAVANVILDETNAKRTVK